MQHGHPVKIKHHSISAQGWPTAPTDVGSSGARGSRPLHVTAAAYPAIGRGAGVR
jgi:hypothetical protein